jgi:hypothetical protein
MAWADAAAAYQHLDIIVSIDIRNSWRYFVEIEKLRWGIRAKCPLDHAGTTINAADSSEVRTSSSCQYYFVAAIIVYIAYNCFLTIALAEEPVDEWRR